MNLEDQNPEDRLEFARDRAFEYLERGKPKEAVDSFVSDISSVSEVQDNLSMIATMAMTLRQDRDLTAKKVVDFINGFDFFSEQKQPKGIIAKQEATATVTSAHTHQKPTEDESALAESFIADFVLHNPDLSYAAKELLVNSARAGRGPWSVKDNVTGIKQDGPKITVKAGKSEFYYYTG